MSEGLDKNDEVLRLITESSTVSFCASAKNRDLVTNENGNAPYYYDYGDPKYLTSSFGNRGRRE